MERLKHFSRGELKQDLAENIAGLLTRLCRIFGPDAATTLIPKVKMDGFSIDSESLAIADLPVTYQFLKLYDYVIGNEWDWFGRHHNPYDIYLDAVGFIAWVKVVDDYYSGVGRFDRCQHLVNAAYARLKIDKLLDKELGEVLTFDEVALLADMNVASVRNAASRGELTIVEYEGEGVRYVDDNKNLDAWLRARRNYRPTRIFDSLDEIDTTRFASLDDVARFLSKQMLQRGVSKKSFKKEIDWTPDRFHGLGPLQQGDLEWFSVDEWEHIAKLLKLDGRWLVARVMKVFSFTLDWTFQQAHLWHMWDKAREEAEEDAFLIPEAGDGTRFRPNLRRKKGYLVGRKGNERYIADYYEAVSVLREMTPPYWRRPSVTTGVFGIVKGVTWRSVPKRNLDNDINAHGKEG